MSAVAGWLQTGHALPPYALAVTVDDGYRDFQHAGPIFAEYQIPVTVYLVTDFLDAKCWLWFDRIVYAFRHTHVPEPSFQMPDGAKLRFRLESDAGRRAAGQHVANLAVALEPAQRRDLIAELPRLLRVELPEQAPPEHRALSWSEVRTLASAGVEFGAHTKTHPILSALISPADLREEVAGSKARIEQELDRPVLHFCYPNGKTADIGPAAIEAVRAAGMQTAVTAEPGLNNLHQNAFLLNRIGADPAQADMYFARRVAGVA